MAVLIHYGCPGFLTSHVGRPIPKSSQQNVTVNVPHELAVLIVALLIVSFCISIETIKLGVYSLSAFIPDLNVQV